MFPAAIVGSKLIQPEVIHVPPYCDLIRSSNLNFDLRYRMVFFAQQHGIRQAARQFDTTRNTVRQ